jgi:MtN3 and saliva related transmembrane protein
VCDCVPTLRADNFYVSSGTLIGCAATVATVVAPLPQLIKTAVTRDVRGFASLSVLASCLCAGLWLIYGVIRHDAAIITCDAMVLVLQLPLLVMIASHRARTLTERPEFGIRDVA